MVIADTIKTDHIGLRTFRIWGIFLVKTLQLTINW